MKKEVMIGLSTVLLLGLAGCQSTNNHKTDSSSNTSKTEASSQYKRLNIKVSVKDAIKHYQNKFPNTDISALDLEQDSGKYVYNIEGIDNNKEYEMKLDAQSNKILSTGSEDLDPDEAGTQNRRLNKLDLRNLASLQKISDKAINHVGHGKATEWSLNKDNETTYWEVEVTKGHQSDTVKIGAQSNKILNTEHDD